MLYNYTAYGLNVRSVFPIPEFTESAEIIADVIIRVEDGRYFEPVDSDGKQWHLSMSASDEALLFARGVGCYLIREGQFISIYPVPNADKTLLRLFLVGNAMGIILFQRGYLVLHASAVELDKTVVAFLGQPGLGKSTTATAFNAMGCNLVADDVLGVNLNSSPITVMPAFPQLKLHPDVISAMGIDTGTIRNIHPYEVKQGYDASKSFAPTLLPLKQIYILTKATSLEIEPLTAQEAIMSLVANSYVTRKSSGVAHLKQCVDLAAKIPVHRLKRPDSLNQLPQLVKMIEEHVGEKRA